MFGRSLARWLDLFHSGDKVSLGAEEVKYGLRRTETPKLSYFTNAWGTSLQIALEAYDTGAHCGPQTLLFPQTPLRP